MPDELDNDGEIFSDEEPALLSGNELENADNDNENADNANIDGDGAGNTPTPVEPKKKRIKNPRVTLNLERLKGPYGLSALMDDHFKNLKCTGDIMVDMPQIFQRYENWCHRLCPQLSFDDCLKRLEDLGRKKEVQTLIQKIRLGLHKPEEEHVELFDDDDDDDKQPTEVNESVVPPDDVFDSLLDSDVTNQKRKSPPLPPATLSSQQLELIELKRLHALEVRAAKMRRDE